MQITAGVIAGADDVRDFYLEEVDFIATVVKLVALLVEAALTFHHAVVVFGGSVVEVIVPPVVLNDIGGSGGGQRPRHGPTLIFIGGPGMACSTALGRRIRRVRRRRRVAGTTHYYYY